MIKTFHRYISTALTALTLGLLGVMPSCSDELDVPMPEDPGAAKDGYITVSLSCSDAVSRAGETEPGVDNLNENRIETVTLCFWQPSGDNTSSKPAYMQTFRDVNAVGKATFNIPLTSEILTQLFKEDGTNKCNVYAAVNVEPGNATTVEELRQLVVNSEFESKMVQPRFTMDGDGEATLTNTGRAVTGSVKVKRSAAKITLALNVEESIEEEVNGEKITWTPNLAGMRVWLMQGVKESTLTPAPTLNMAPDCYFNTPDKNEYLFGQNPDAQSKYTKSQTTPFYTYPNKWTLENNERHRTHMVLSVPWTPDGGKTYRTCYYQVPVVPMTATETVRNISYHINLHVGVLGSFVPEEPEEIEAEYWVADWSNENIDVDIKDYRYLVVDQNEFTVNNETSISIPFYTSHPTKVISAKMTFYRYNFSDEGTEFAITVDETTNNNSLTKGGKKVFTAEFDNTKKILTVTHDLTIWQPYKADGTIVDLTNDIENKGANRQKTQTQSDIDNLLRPVNYFKEINDDEFSRVEFEVTVQHTDVAEDPTLNIDKNLYKETVKITQYPGMYITAVQNYSGLLGKDWANGALGNTIINGRWDNTTYTINDDWNNLRKTIRNYMNWDYSLGLSTGFLNWNPNMYLITITTLPSETEYTIGDPRSYNINNDLSNNHDNYTVDGGTTDVFKDEYWYFQTRTNSASGSLYGRPYSTPQQYSSTYWVEYKLRGFQTANALEGGRRTLKDYYPTRENMNNQSTIAPKFRICSSYGGTSTYLTREMARRRAAAYQELGYCAGRWRLPTFGEVKFVMELSRQNKIPRLFGRDVGVWYYWCAQGAVLVPKRGDKTTEIRIVETPGQNGNPIGGTTAVAPFTGNNYRDHARFVYDEWYWGAETLTPSSATPNANSPTYTFTWGDRPKTSPQDE